MYSQKKIFLNILKTCLSLFLLICILSSCDSDEQTSWNWQESIEFGRCPKWSPNGESIIFGDDRTGVAGIYLWDTETDPVRLTDSSHFHNWDYCWSPNGEFIAFTSPGAREDSLSGIWILEVATKFVTQVYDYGKDVSWYSTGLELAVRFDNPSEGEPGIYRLGLTEDKNAVTEARLEVLSGHMPECSPKYNWLAYSDNEIDGRLHILDFDGVEQYVSGHGVRQYKWSSDGKFLAFVINNYTSGILENVLWGINIAQMEADSLTRMATFPAPNQNGNEVAFSRVQTGNWSGLWVFSQSEGIGRVSSFGLSPDYNPVSDKIAVNSSLGGIRIIVRE